MHKEFSKDIWQSIEKCLKNQKLTRPLVAAFDADGTLWDIDLGETFFQYQIKHCNLKLPPDPWNYYHELKKVNNDPRSAYLWLSQINKGQKIEQVYTWAEDCVENISGGLPIFPSQKKLIELLLKNNVEVYIVSASITWSVQPGARRLGVKSNHVLGVETKVQNGVVTEEANGLVTWREGKVQKLLERTGGVKPFLSVGNTMGDISLLEAATDIKIAVRANPKGHELWETEEQLFQVAQSKKWFIHNFKN